MKRAILGAWLGSIGLLCGPHVEGYAQTPPRMTGAAPAADARPTLRPRSALQAGVELYRRGEYEEADKHFQLAYHGRAQLDATEQGQLGEYMRRNTEALQARQQAVTELPRRCSSGSRRAATSAPANSRRSPGSAMS